MAVTYSKNGSKTTFPIDYSSTKHKILWSLGNLFGFNIVRQRAVKTRYEITRGDTFRGYHFGKISVFKELKRPTRGLYNPSMQVLEVPDSQLSGLLK